MPVIFKPVIPAKLREQAFIDEIEKAAKSVKDGILKDYELGVKDWDHKVEFRTDVNINPNGGVSIEIDTDDEIYFYVHEGTRPHIIKPRRAKRLAFPSLYTPKTQPGRISSAPGGAGGRTVTAGMVQHPGTKGRFFSKLIVAKWRGYFERQMERALKRGAERSGHGI